MKKRLRHSIARILTTCMVAGIFPASGFNRVFNSIQLSKDEAYLTENDQRISLEVNLGYKPEDVSKLEWSLGGRPFSEWRQYNDETLAFSGRPMISFATEPYYDALSGKVKAVLDIDAVHEDPNDDYARNFNLDAYQPIMGTQYLAVTDPATDSVFNCKFTLRPYEDYHFYGDIKPRIDSIMHNAKLDRYVEYVPIGVSSQGRVIHGAIVAKDKASVDKYLNETLPMMLKEPEKLQKRLADGRMGDYKLPIWFSNIHPQEAPCTDGILNAFDVLVTGDSFTYDVYGRTHEEPVGDKWGRHVETNEKLETVTVDVDELLEDVIVLFDFTTNTDGREMNQRFNGNNFDLNRDCALQTQPESQAVLNMMGAWRPTIVLEYHGYYPEFVIEPCTPPHDPNVEVDLLLPNNLELAHAMGDAGIGNTYYTEFQICSEDRFGGWEDLSPNFTDFYCQSLGCIGNMVEIPWPDKESRSAIEYCTYAALNYMAENKDKLFQNQLEYYRRGILGLDLKESVDPYMIGADGTAVGRPRGEHENFFPEYYIIPVSSALQRNPSEAYHIADLLLNSGVEVSESTKSVVFDGVTYPAGSFVVDMHQATRALANNLLYDGMDISDFKDIYSENLIATRYNFGFDRVEVRTPGIFNGALRELKSVKAPTTTEIKTNSSYYVIKNTSNNAIRAVNALLSSDEPVRMLTANGKNVMAGDFVVSKKAMNLLKDRFFLEVDAYNGKEPTVTLTEPQINVKSYCGRENIDGGLEFALKGLGFDLTTDQSASDIVVSTAAYDVKEDILNGKPYIGLGRGAASFLADSNLIPGYAHEIKSSFEALVRTDVDDKNPITARYSTYDAAYYIGRGVRFTQLPDNATILARASTEDDFMIAGNWPGKQDLKGTPLAFTVPVGDTSITMFSGNLTYKAMAQDTWRMLATAIYSATAE